uniref:Putative secreted protein n=1 Tax=Anopheles darlingi TaxID=43151 RepID=A0A2M4D393_ANODA
MPEAVRLMAPLACCLLLDPSPPVSSTPEPNPPLPPANESSSLFTSTVPPSAPAALLTASSASSRAYCISHLITTSARSIDKRRYSAEVFAVKPSRCIELIICCTSWCRTG